MTSAEAARAVAPHSTDVAANLTRHDGDPS